MGTLLSAHDERLFMKGVVESINHSEEISQQF